jgi:hypothetical protein
MVGHNKFLSSFTKDAVEKKNSSTIVVQGSRILEQETGDVSVIDLPSPDEYDLLHYFKSTVTDQDVSFRYQGKELVKAYKQHKQNVQFYQINGTWVL